MGKHVMLSYNWDHQELVDACYQYLTDLGVPCWMDIHGGIGKGAANINEAMAVGVENAACVIPFISEQYQNSKNCRKELNYADNQEIPVIPVMADKNKKYKPTKWLGIIVAGLLYFDLRNPTKFDETLKQLAIEIQHRHPELIKGSAKLSALAPPAYDTPSASVKSVKSTGMNVKFIYGNTYYRIPDEEAKTDGENKIIHRWKLFVKIVEGNAKMIKKVTLDLGKYLGSFDRTSPNANNEFGVSMDTWGSIKQRPRVITVEFSNGQKRTYEHTLHYDQGFMSCPLSLRVSNEPIEYVYGNTYEHIPHDKADKTKEGKILEHRWKLYLKVLKGDPNYFRRVIINLGKNWSERKYSAPDEDNEFSTGYEISWGTVGGVERQITLEFADGETESLNHKIVQSGDGWQSEVCKVVPSGTMKVPMSVVQSLPFDQENVADELDFTFTLNDVEYRGTLFKNDK